MTQDKKDKKDLTRIEDLSDFFHEDSSEESFLTEETLTGASEFTHEPNNDFESPPEFKEAIDEINFTSESFAEPETEALEETPSIPDETWEEAEENIFKDEPVQESTEQETQPYVSPLEEVAHFAQKLDLSDLPAEANPSFSIILNQVKFSEDADEILDIIREVEIFNKDLEQIKKSLARGSVLLPRMSEFMALTLLHRFRRFDLELKMGLSDLLHPSKNLEPDLGLITKSNISQNQSHNFDFKSEANQSEDIMLSLSPHIEGYEIIRYGAIARESMNIDASLVDEENSDDLMKIYQDLSEKLKPHALENQLNAVVGVQFQLQPIKDKYKLVCSGSLALVKKL